MATITTVGVVGAGTMGLGITQVCAVNGFATILYDLDARQVERAVASIAASLQTEVNKGRLTPEEKSGALSRIRPVSTLADLKADLVIEAAVERLDVKKELFGNIEKVNSGEAILATNTSSISISQIAAALRNPSRFVGLHFFNPADRMKLVEIISGVSTKPEIVEAMRKFASALKKTAVLAKDSPGFIVNRVARPFYAEALRLIDGGAATVPAVDRLLRASGFRMGPFELMDLIGVDTNLAVTTSVFEGMGCPSRFAPSVLQQQLVREGRLGRKSGRGFYEYGEKVN